MSNPFRLDGIPWLIRWPTALLTGFGTLRRWYDEWTASEQGGPTAFVDFSFRKLDIGHHLVNEEQLAALPAEGPLIIVANHPLGAVEGMLLTRLLLARRPDLKVLTNEMLLRIPEFQDTFIGVDVLRSGQEAHNARALRGVTSHLAAGGALMVFPAGTVSRMTWRDWTIRDVPWNSFVGRLATKYKATCMPVYVDGRNPRWFYLSGLLHPLLRTALLPRAMMALRRRSVALRLGRPLTVPPFLGAQAATDALRLASELLAPGQQVDNTSSFADCPLAEPQAAATLRQEMQRLEDKCVHRRGDYAVYIATFAELGPVAEHLAREREATFRLAGEGTGKALDIDRYDHSHLHIMVWDHGRDALVGGYRVADAQAIIASHGLQGLYSYSLYRFDAAFVDRLGGAMEVGRSFVTPHYQADLHALDLLWCGLGAFVKLHPHCHTFFGCVSIAQTYPPLLRSLITAILLRRHGRSAEEQAATRAVAPYQAAAPCWSASLVDDIADLAALNKLLGAIDPQWRVPVMIRHYLALGGHFFGFALNTGFNAAVDGLVAVDLRHSSLRYLRRYMGDDGAAEFCQRWQRPDLEQAMEIAARSSGQAVAS